MRQPIRLKNFPSRFKKAPTARQPTRDKWTRVVLSLFLCRRYRWETFGQIGAPNRALSRESSVKPTRAHPLVVLAVAPPSLSFAATILAT